MEQPIVKTDTILSFLKGAVETKKTLNPEIWMDAAFKLNVLLSDEHDLMEEMRQDVAIKKLHILQSQDKRNVAAADLEIEATDEYRLMRLQEHKVDRIEEFIKIAKKNAKQY